MAASNDVNTTKTLLFGASSSTWNHGRSKLEVATAAGFHAVGTQSNPTLIDMMPGSTYYSFTDSGTLTVSFASFTHLDEGGIQLNGKGPFSINSSSFDFVGDRAGVSTSTIFTLNTVTQSTITLTNDYFGNNGIAAHAYNYTIKNSSTGLQWTHIGYTGGLVGDAHEFNDTSNHILWSTAPTGVVLSNVYVTSATLSWTAVAGRATSSEPPARNSPAELRCRAPQPAPR